MFTKLLGLAALAAAALAPLCAHAAQVPGDGFVVVDADGSLARGSKGYQATHVATGQYEIDVFTSVHTCAYSVTAGSSDTTAPPLSFVTAVGREELPTAIMVATYDLNKQPADHGFQLIVRC